MRRADRLFDIVQSLPAAARPMTAAALRTPLRRVAGARQGSAGRAALTDMRGRQRRRAASSQPLGRDLLHDFEDRAAARHSIAPHPIEIGDKGLHLL
jgi:hypothetical protein